MSLDEESRIREREASVRELEEKLASLGFTRDRREAGPPEVALRSIAGLEQKVIQLNDDLEVEYVNSALADALRLDREKIKGAPLREIDLFPWGTGHIEVLVDLARPVWPFQLAGVRPFPLAPRSSSCEGRGARGAVRR